MREEHSDTHSAYTPFPSYSVRTRAEALEEIARPCGEFKSPLSTEEKMRSFIFEKIAHLDILPGEHTLIANGTPLNWQCLLQYLQQNGILVRPDFIFNRQAHDRPKLFNAQLALQQDVDLSDGKLSADAAFGASLSKEEALSKTVGEALERFFLSKYKRDDLKHASYRQIKRSRKHTLDINTLNGFLPWQKELRTQLSCTEDSELYWVVGEEYPSGKKIYLPAQLVFWNYKHDEEKMLARITTSGCAGHFTKEQAVLAGLLENIQRDGFLVYWLNNLAPRVLDISTVHDPEVDAFMEYLKRYRMEVIFLNTTTDIGVPTVTCVAIDRASEGGPIISLGAAAGFDIPNLLIHSAIEAVIVNAYAANNDTCELKKDYLPFRDASITRRERLTMWKGPEMEKRIRPFLSGEKQSVQEFIGTANEVKKPKEQLEYVMRRFEKLGRGYEVYVYEVRSPILKALGYHVVRTIVPQLLPLYLLEHTAPLDSRRLREVPEKLGYKAASEPNPWPHPFP